MTPALRIRNEPATKMKRSLIDGHPCDASTNDHKVGKSKRRVPVWFQSRIRLAKASNLGWDGRSLTESVEGESGIKTKENIPASGENDQESLRGLEVR